MASTCGDGHQGEGGGGDEQQGGGGEDGEGGVIVHRPRRLPGLLPYEEEEDDEEELNDVVEVGAEGGSGSHPQFASHKLFASFLAGFRGRPPSAPPWVKPPIL